MEERPAEVWPMASAWGSVPTEALVCGDAAVGHAAQNSTCPSPLRPEQPRHAPRISRRTVRCQGPYCREGCRTGEAFPVWKSHGQQRSLPRGAVRAPLSGRARRAFPVTLRIARALRPRSNEAQLRAFPDSPITAGEQQGWAPNQRNLSKRAWGEKEGKYQVSKFSTETLFSQLQE